MRRGCRFLLFLTVLWLASAGLAGAAVPVVEYVGIYQGRDFEPMLPSDFHYGTHLLVSDGDGAADIVSLAITDPSGREYILTPTGGYGLGCWLQWESDTVYVDWAVFDQREGQPAGCYTVTATDAEGLTGTLATPVIPEITELGPQPVWPLNDTVIEETVPIFQWDISGLHLAGCSLGIEEEGLDGEVWSANLGEQSGPTIEVPCGVELKPNRSYLMWLGSLWREEIGSSDPRVELWIGHRTWSRFTVYGEWPATPPNLPGKLVYTQFYHPFARRPAIMQYNTSPSARVWLTPHDCLYPAWSPDGESLLYRQGMPLPPAHVIDRLDGSPRVEIAGSSNWSDAAWAPDGKRIVYSDGDIWVAYADGSGEPYLLESYPDFYERYPSWSPDGRWIAYGKGAGGYPTLLWLIGDDGTQDHALVPAGVEGHPEYSCLCLRWETAWSPDATKLAAVFTAWTPDWSQFIRGIGTIPLEGGPITPVFIAPPAIECCAAPHWPYWSPDGTQIVFSSGHHLAPDPDWINGKLEPGVELWLVNADGSGEPTRLTYDYSWDGFVSWWDVDRVPPVLVAPPDLTVEESDPLGTPVELGQPTVSDLRDPNPTVENDAPGLFPLGTTVVTWTATDASGNVATAQQKVTVVPGPPANQLDNLAELISQCVLSGQIAPELESSLLAKVQAALDALARGNPNDAKAAMGELKALVNQVEAQTDKKIEPAVAAEIIRRANQIIAALGG